MIQAIENLHKVDVRECHSASRSTEPTYRYTGRECRRRHLAISPRSHRLEDRKPCIRIRNRICPFYPPFT